MKALGYRCRRRQFAALATLLLMVADTDESLHRSEALACRCPDAASPALATASVVLTLFLRVMSKLR